MIILIAGSSHTGKTLMAIKLLENIVSILIHWPLKMGLIRSGKTALLLQMMIMN